MWKNILGTHRKEQSHSPDPKTQDFQTELHSLRRKLEQVQERNKRWAEKKSEWIQQRAKLCRRIRSLNCDLSKQQEELQKAKSGPNLDDMVLLIEAAMLDKQNLVLQLKYLQARVMQLEEQLLQKNKEWQELKEKQELWETVKIEKEEKGNKWKCFKSLFRKRETSSKDSPEKKQAGLCPLSRLLRRWRRSSMSEELIWCGSTVSWWDARLPGCILILAHPSSSFTTCNCS